MDESKQVPAVIYKKHYIEFISRHARNFYVISRYDFKTDTETATGKVTEHKPRYTERVRTLTNPQKDKILLEVPEKHWKKCALGNDVLNRRRQNVTHMKTNMEGFSEKHWYPVHSHCLKKYCNPRRPFWPIAVQFIIAVIITAILWQFIGGK